MRRLTLLAWLGLAYLNAFRGDQTIGLGPIAQAVKSRDYNHIHPLSYHKKSKEMAFQAWLKSLTQADIMIIHGTLSGPT